MRPRAPEIPETAFRAFIQTFGLLRRQMEPYFSRFGISSSQWGVLRTLQRARNEGLQGLRLTDLGHRLLVQPPSVTTVVDRLERTGLVVRSPAASGDHRAKLVKLTPAGRRLVARVLKQHPKQIEVMLACLDGDQQRQLQALMEKMAAHLESLGQVQADKPVRAHDPPEGGK